MTKPEIPIRLINILKALSLDTFWEPRTRNKFHHDTHSGTAFQNAQTFQGSSSLMCHEWNVY